VEQPVSSAGDKAGGQKGDGGQKHHHQSDLPADAKHEPQRAQNGHHTGKQLRKSKQQSVRKLIHVGNHPVDGFPVGMVVNVLEREDLDLAEGCFPDIPDDLKGDPVVDSVSQPLQKGGDGGHDADPDQQPHDSGKIHPAFSDDQINGPSDQNGDVQGQNHRSCDQQK